MSRSILTATIDEPAGMQVVTLGIMMMSMGVWFATAWFGNAAYAHLATTGPLTDPVAPSTVPTYLQQVQTINTVAVWATFAALLTLLGLDWFACDPEPRE